MLLRRSRTTRWLILNGTHQLLVHDNNMNLLGNNIDTIKTEVLIYGSTVFLKWTQRKISTRICCCIVTRSICCCNVTRSICCCIVTTSICCCIVTRSMCCCIVTRSICCCIVTTMKGEIITTTLKYLGAMVTNQNVIQGEVKRLNSGNTCYHSVQNLPSSGLLSKNT
jgi:hypothetical protein